MRAILVIDDDPTNLARTLRALEVSGQYTVLCSPPLPPGLPPATELRDRLRMEYNLTPREVELTLVALREPLTYAQIAAQQLTTHGTIKTYYKRIFHKLGIRRREELHKLFAH